MKTAFEMRGWVKLPWAGDVADWAAEAHGVSLQAIAAPENAHWLQCEGTWFVGVDLLPNDATGQLGAVPFPKSLTDRMAALGLPDLPLHPAQVSVMYPGYPRPRKGESEAAFRYRRTRDAAHLDGLLPVGPERRRMLKEPHGYILGIPLTETSPEASPLVIWDGSHHLLRAALDAVLADHAAEDWHEVDLTDAYQAARRHIFETCPRRSVHARPGEAYLLHRLALHGVASWANGAEAPPEGRMIAYLRPELAGSPEPWITRP